MKTHNEEYVVGILKGVLEASVKTSGSRGFLTHKLSGTEILEICKYINELGHEGEVSDYLGTIEPEDPPL